MYIYKCKHMQSKGFCLLVLLALTLDLPSAGYDLSNAGRDLALPYCFHQQAICMLADALINTAAQVITVHFLIFALSVYLLVFIYGTRRIYFNIRFKHIHF